MGLQQHQHYSLPVSAHTMYAAPPRPSAGVPAASASCNSSHALQSSTRRPRRKATTLISTSSSSALSGGVTGSKARVCVSTTRRGQTRQQQGEGGGGVRLSCSNTSSCLQASEYPRRENVRDCDHYLKTGSCNYGMRCIFNHPERDARLLEALSRRECFDFVHKGFCNYGDSCKYIHPHLQKALSTSSTSSPLLPPRCTPITTTPLTLVRPSAPLPVEHVSPRPHSQPINVNATPPWWAYGLVSGAGGPMGMGMGVNVFGGGPITLAGVHRTGTTREERKVNRFGCIGDSRTPGSVLEEEEAEEDEEDEGFDPLRYEDQLFDSELGMWKQNVLSKLGKRDGTSNKSMFASGLYGQ